MEDSTNLPGKDKDNRVGGGVAPAVLPHHRAYGSVHGGSRGVLKASELVT